MSIDFLQKIKRPEWVLANFRIANFSYQIRINLLDVLYFAELQGNATFGLRYKISWPNSKDNFVIVHGTEAGVDDAAERVANRATKGRVFFAWYLLACSTLPSKYFSKNFFVRANCP